MIRRTPLRPGRKSIARGSTFSSPRKPLPKVNRAKRKRLDEEQYGPIKGWLKAKCCDNCGRPGPCDPSHVKTRGSGGKWWQQLPHCRLCHRWFEDLPAREKQKLLPRAADYVRRFLREFPQFAPLAPEDMRP